MIFIKIYYFILGACIGSFLNVLIFRLPDKNKESVKRRSHCPSCDHLIAFYDNIPIISYLILLGKCRYCSFKIPWTYVFNEILMGVAGLWILGSSQTVLPDINSLLLFSLLAAFVVHFWIDCKHQILPDSVNLYIAAVGFSLSFFLYNSPWTHWFLGALIGFGGTFLITYFYYLWRKVQGFGGGDLKLFGALGFLLGPQGIVLNIFFSCFVGAFFGSLFLLKTKKSSSTPFAFGPAIILVSIFQIYWPQGFAQLSKLIFGF